jgi:hypothetical protein
MKLLLKRKATAANDPSFPSGELSISKSELSTQGGLPPPVEGRPDVSLRWAIETLTRSGKLRSVTIEELLLDAVFALIKRFYGNGLQ